MTIPRKRTSDPAVATAEDKAEAIMAPMPCFVYLCSSELVVLSASPNSSELIGIRPENLVGQQALWNERISPEDRRRLLSRLSELERGDFASEIHRIIDDLGLPVWVVHSVQKVTAGKGSEIHGSMIRLPADFRSKSIESSIIAQFVHKIGNHFQLMNLLIGSLKRTATNLDEIESLQQTIDKAVDFTRSFSHFSQSTAAPTPVEIAELLRSVAKSAASLAFEKGVGVELLLDASIEGMVIPGDAFLLEFAFGALLENSLDATQKGDQIMIRAGRALPAAGKTAIAHIAMIDTGHGIEKELLAKVTDPFFTSKRDRDGLGLSSAVRILEIHGGAVSLSSVRGRGTEVHVRLPINDAESIPVSHVQRSHC